jgi:primosomal protein N' (replication factor Y)
VVGGRGAGRVLGAPAPGRVLGAPAPGRVLVQTRVPKHEVLDAALHADPGRLAAIELPRRQALARPPFSALALVSGEGAAVLAGALEGVEVSGPDGDGRWLVRAPDQTTLGDALGRVPRPPGRLRVEVDPLRA